MVTVTLSIDLSTNGRREYIDNRQILVSKNSTIEKYGWEAVSVLKKQIETIFVVLSQSGVDGS